MKILHLSTNDLAGGAARAAYRLHAGLLNEGHDSSMLVRQRQSCDPRVQVFDAHWSPLQRIWGWLRAKRIELGISRSARNRPPGLGPFTDDRSRFGAALAQAVPDCDIVHLHWVADDFLDYRSFFAAMSRRQIPVVWTLHDLNTFTGGCHYTEGCDRWQTECGCCPQLGSGAESDVSRAIFRRKRALFDHIVDQRRFVAVGASRWTAQLARESRLLRRFPVRVIPLGVNHEQFRPLDRMAVRQALGIDDATPVVLFVAENITSKRKGLSLLLAALRTVARDIQGLQLVCVGAMRRELAGPELPVINLGTVADDRLLALIYSAADVFVIPSREEAFGLTALEAMACGTPVVGFDAGGIPDMVRPGQTGLLASVGDEAALAAAVTKGLTDDGVDAHMARECRRVVLDEYTLAHQARAYVGLYEEMRGKAES